MKVIFSFIFSFCLLSLTMGQANGDIIESQDESKDDSEKMRYEKYALGFSASALANFYSGIQLSHDIGLRPRLNLAVETAYIHGSIYTQYTNGFRLKSGIQYILAANDYIAVTAGVNHIYRMTNSPRDFSVFYFQDNYSEDFTLDRWKHLNALEGTFSLMLKITDRLRLELGVGVGAGYLKVNDENTTLSRTIVDSFTTNGGFFLETTRSSFVPIGSFNVNVSYILFKS